MDFLNKKWLINKVVSSCVVIILFWFSASITRLYAEDSRDIATLQKREDTALSKTKLTEQDISQKSLSLNFQNISIRAVLQILAEFIGLNIVVSDTVQGNISLHLKNVPWDQALQFILRSQGMVAREISGVMMIAPAEEMFAREKKELEAVKQVTELAPLVSELIQINYANATQIAALLKGTENSLLSSRGSVSVDVRTNTLWLQDIASKIDEVRKLLVQLDIPVKQVLIEARIVLVDKRFEQDLGIDWGLTKANNITGTLRGANKMKMSGSPDAVAVDDRLNVNFAVDAIKNPASVGVALVKLSNNTFLDLELSALESEGRGELISSPRLITANQQAAHIEKGEEIPYEESTSSGATSVVFKKAVLSLDVTPQITPDNKIIMNIKVNQDKPSSTLEVKGVPGIDTREIQTQVLVDNGQTLVLGGIFEQDKSKQVKRVPFLGSLPLIGYAFSSEQEISNRSELLIFITPKIVQEELS
jgi:type IV pilus assembly protein PilQ